MLATCVLACSSSFAGTMGPICVPGSVTVPCESTAWDVRVYALYLKTSFNADPIGYIGSYLNNTHRNYNGWNSDFGWGFKLEGSYHFNTGNDFNVNWIHYRHTSSNNMNFSFANANWVSPTSFKTQWDAVNFEFGQHTDFGEHKNIRFHGGAQYTNIKNNLQLNNWSNQGVSTVGDVKFRGFGPRAGIDMAYDWRNGFAVYANTAAALLLGTTKFNTWNNSTNTSTSGSKDSVVPEVEAKLGAKYNYAIAQGMVSVDGGWMYVNYFNPLHAFGGNFNGATDVAFNGPYLGLKWLGNA